MRKPVKCGEQGTKGTSGGVLSTSWEKNVSCVALHLQSAEEEHVVWILFKKANENTQISPLALSRKLNVFFQIPSNLIMVL